MEYVHNEKLEFSYLSSWSGLEDKQENYLWVCYYVSPIENGTLLVISQSNYDEDKAKHSERNWADIINGMKSVIE